MNSKSSHPFKKLMKEFILHGAIALGETQRKLSTQILALPIVFTMEVLGQYHLKLSINPNFIKI